MDWSLVLASQAIESIIEPATDGGQWELLVKPHEYEHALRSIQQYRLENRGWPWRQQVLQRGVFFDWGSLAWAALVVLFYWLDVNAGLRSAGMMNSAEVSHGQWWRLFTAVWLHADLAHLASNTSIGFVLLGLAMGRYGTGLGLLAAYLAGASGNLAGLLLDPQHLSVGASGMVSGCLGLLAAQSIAFWPHSSRPIRYLLTGIAAGTMLFILMGLDPKTDVLAHAGGFISGLIFGALLSLRNLSTRSAAQVFSGAIFTLLVTLPWYLAMRGHH